MSSGRRGWSVVARAVAAAVGAPTTEARETLAAEIADERVEVAKGGGNPTGAHRYVTVLQ